MEQWLRAAASVSVCESIDEMMVLVPSAWLHDNSIYLLAKLSWVVMQ
jgi:hypothetical protein